MLIVEVKNCLTSGSNFPDFLMIKRQKKALIKNFIFVKEKRKLFKPTKKGLKH